MGNYYVKPERKGNNPYTRSGLSPPPIAKKSGKDLPSHRFNDMMSLEMHMADERARTAGLTPAERQWRMKYVHDQHLHPDEPIHVDAVHRQLNPIRIIYRWPWDKLYQHFLRPTFGIYYGTAIRVLAPKLAMGFLTFQVLYYYWKYEAKDWTHLRGVETMKKKDILLRAKEIEEHHPGLIEQASLDPAKYRYFGPSYDKRTALLNHDDSMRRSKLLIAILVIIFLIYYFQDSGPVLKTREKSHSIILHYCQFLEEKIFGNESIIQNDKDFDLKGLIVAFRHGERSPLVSAEFNSGNPDCSAYFDVDRKSFEEYIDFVNSNDFRSYVTTDRIFDEFAWHPERSKCMEGNLTAEGALQIVKLGNFLRQKYSLTSLFKGSPNVTMSASLFYRTFQSGIAFVSSFFFPQSKVVEKIYLKASNTTYFCMNKNCTCSKIAGFRKEFEKIRSSLYFRRFPELSDDLDRMATLMGLQRISHPLSLVDFALGRYACRRLPFPCFDNSKCLTIEKFTEAIDVVGKLVREMFPLSKDLRRLFAAESYPISQTVATVIRKLRKSSDPSQIRIFSGHDITIVPFIFTLGLNMTNLPPPYGSRLVFEVYELKSKNVINDSLFLRVLLNGVDQTNNLQFCKSFYSGLCPARYFESFVKNTLLQEIANIQSITELCQ